MLEISFESEQEAQSFYMWLAGRAGEAGMSVTMEQPASVEIIAGDGEIRSFLIPLLSEYITEKMESLWILSILENQFYFTDTDELQQILNISQSIMEGERTDIPNVERFSGKEEFVKETLGQFIQPGLRFSFHSFVRFRLSGYMHKLKRYAEAAIEEYKLEQEYQSFIQLLREYVIQKHPLLAEVHVFHRRHFLIYNGEYKEMTDTELRRVTDRDLLCRHPVYIDTALLAPLVSMAPGRIFLYSDDPDHGMIQTIQNVFQERVMLRPEVSFYLNSKKIP
ncbi:putative sporulation protein YtxC [Bacillus mangrovi]|uniref:Putative sporulation protein YtxC n=1 Tax=Metabacillus mangrovi TaxID=1491830 RepID=A0A7X2S3A0_9BACI|nr:putative sporulation protein YtxC [Metabacillus mangrovi]MTH52893.1 putative sporulation protein YtxC [Metabacillus mangrovi]